MHAHEHDTAHPSYLGRVATAIAATQHDYDHAAAMPRTTDTDRAIRAGRLALICARRAAWWSVLHRALVADLAAPMLHAQTALIAAEHDKCAARFWRDLAADWRARAEQRPTSDAAGALSNWDQPGVTG